MWHSTSGSCASHTQVSPQINKIPLPFPASWVSSVLQLPLLPFVSLHPFSGEVHKSTATCRESTHPTCELTHMTGRVNTHSRHWKVTTWRFVCSGRTIICSMKSVVLLTCSHTRRGAVWTRELFPMVNSCSHSVWNSTPEKDWGPDELEEKGECPESRGAQSSKGHSNAFLQTASPSQLL